MFQLAARPTVASLYNFTEYSHHLRLLLVSESTQDTSKARLKALSLPGSELRTLLVTRGSVLGRVSVTPCAKTLRVTPV